MSKILLRNFTYKVTNLVLTFASLPGLSTKQTEIKKQTSSESSFSAGMSAANSASSCSKKGYRIIN